VSWTSRTSRPSRREDDDLAKHAKPQQRLFRRTASVALSLGLLGTSTVAQELGRDEGWKRVEPGLELTFPADHGAHPGYRTEWWYLTGQLSDARGHRFGYQFTLFRRGLDPRPPAVGDSPLRAHQVWAGHLALTDIGAQRTRFAERLRRGGTPLAGAARDDLALTIEDWSLVREDDRLRLLAGDPEQGFSLALELEPAGPLVLHGAGGYSAKGGEPGNASAYVSWPRLATRGLLRLDERETRVEGESWFDHEFGSGVLAADCVGWDWFGLQLDDGSELMVFGLRHADGSLDDASAGTWIAPDGSTRALGRADFRLGTTRRWTSPRTAADYPAGWTLEIPSLELVLELAPPVADCELISSSTRVSYWEGPVEVRGTRTGRGYAELTGHAGSMAGRF